MRLVLDAALPDPLIERVKASVRMAAAGGTHYTLLRANRTAGLIEIARRNWPALVIQSLASGNGAEGGATPPSGSPLIPVIGYVRKTDVGVVARAFQDRWPLQGILIEDVSDKPWDVLETLQSAYRYSLRSYLEPDLLELAGDRLGTLSADALFDGRRITVPLLAELYGTSRRTLRRHFAHRDLPRPERWASWLNVLLATTYLSASRRTIDSVGFALGFDSGGAISQVCRRLTGTGLSAFRNSDGYERLLEHLRRECAQVAAGSAC